jgi:hypothetical protein
MTNLLSEWSAILERDSSHPSVVVWVPLNESWGIQDIEHDPRQQAFSRSVADLTRALDGTRPVISNDGWEHTVSDILTIHDYAGNGDHIRHHYRSREAVTRMASGRGPAGRLISLQEQHPDTPLMLSEFGGVSMADPSKGDWGYSVTSDLATFTIAVLETIAAAASAPGITGFCYTQLTDTGLETNGLLTSQREVKIPTEKVRDAVTAQVATTTQPRCALASQTGDDSASRF